MSAFLPVAVATCARKPRWSSGGQIPDAGAWPWGCRYRMALSMVSSWSGQVHAQLKLDARRGVSHQARRERAQPSWNDHFLNLNLFALKMAPVLHHPPKNDFFPLSLRNCLRPTVGNSVATPLPFRMVFVGWSLCDDRIQNTQCKVALKRLTATLCSNYVEHIESLRF
jgi:hypothetical protein